MSATCPTCGGESMLRGRCVLPWCSSRDEKGDSEPSVPVSSASDASGVVVDGSEAESATEAVYCDRGICAALKGHEGTCAEASGWADEPAVIPAHVAKVLDTIRAAVAPREPLLWTGDNA